MTNTDYGLQRASADELARLHAASLDRLTAREAAAEALHYEPDHSQELVFGDIEKCTVCHQKRYVQRRDEGRSITTAVDRCEQADCPFIKV